MIAILGTSTMGAPMAQNAAAAGLEVVAWNRTKEKAEGIEGVSVASSAEEAVRGADLVVTMLANADAVSAVMEDDGALAAMGDGAIWVQMATVGIAGTEQLAALAEERGVTFVDAPVSGTKEPAEQGNLIVLASGPDSAREACTPLFDAVGASTQWLGEAGAGSRTKLVINSWLLSLTEAVAESVAFAQAIDVDPKTFLSIIEGGPLDSDYAQLKGGAMIESSFEPSFSLNNAAKDAGLVLDAAKRHDQEMPLVGVVHDHQRSVIDQGYGDEDMAATYRASAPEG